MFIEKLKRVKAGDICQIWKLPVALLCMPFARIRHKDLWIVCEDKNEARDNGYWFFKYLREQHPEQDCVYAIDCGSPDFERIHALGPTVEYGSFRHWVLYLASRKKISSQKAGNPNAAIFYFLEVYGLLRDKRVFLQHGVIKDDLKWLYYNVTRMNRFICGAYPEWKYVSRTYGYPEGNVCYTGLCRFDGLHDAIPQRMVLVMPTWREWIADEDERLEQYEGTREIPKTNYFRAWTDFMRDARIEALARKYQVKFIFFPHRNMQKYLGYFPESTQYIEIAGANRYGVQELMKSASMMVTDYSSVFFDMIYMKKPIAFYQFDLERYRSGQYAEGYFHYDDNPFGRSCQTKDDIFNEIERSLENNFAVSPGYLRAHGEYFPIYDQNNCRRVYDVVKEL